MIALLASWKDAAPAAAAITAFLSAFVALLVFRYTRLANRRRATLDMVMKTLLDENSQKRQAAFKAVVKKDKDTEDCFKIESLLDVSSAGSEDRTAVLHHLNIYELMALGIKRGIFDEAFYKRWYHNQFMTDYEHVQPFISGLQEKKHSIYCECSALYQKWLKSGHPEMSAGRLKMAYWALLQKNDKIDQARAKDKAR